MHMTDWLTLAIVAVCCFGFGSWLTTRPLKTTEKKKDGKIVYRSLSPQDAWSLLEQDKKIILLDVRTPDEFSYSHLPNSKNIPLNKLDENAHQKLGNRNKTILTYCQSGARSKQATKLLYVYGFTNVYDIGGLETFYKRKPQKTNA